MALRDQPLLSEVFDPLSDFRPIAGSAYVFGSLPEDRSEHVQAWRSLASGVEYWTIQTQEENRIIGEKSTGEQFSVSLRSTRELKNLWHAYVGRDAYLDITGLEHQVWAPLLKAALESKVRLAVVYVEPAGYAFSRTPTEGQIFDLSVEIRGIAPLPGFATLTESVQTEDLFIPLLGFEGTRLSHVIEHVQPAADRIIPVVGVPGFRPEYPFHAYIGNKNPMLETEAWQSIRFALANCPFSLFYELESISKERPRGVLRIAPIGTKPHGLGAILFKLASQRGVELIYDHPVRRAKRTSGVDRLFVYHVSGLFGA
ncbi:MAG: hypothetical protein KF869_08015 [Phycisphaeraceae bacterium]|nr:hypothetical protein [Phycisphaeraceae bacterium]